VHKVGNKIECNNMHGERIKKNKMVFIAWFISCISMTATGAIYLERQKVTCSCLS